MLQIKNKQNHKNNKTQQNKIQQNKTQQKMNVNIWVMGITSCKQNTCATYLHSTMKHIQRTKCEEK